MSSSTHRDYVEAAGYELRRPDASRLLVLLHGLGGDRNQALGLIKRASLEDVTILAPDARAHGATTLIGEAADFTFPAMVRDLLTLIRATRQTGKPTYIAGISMGAAIALQAVSSRALNLQGVSYVRPAFTDEPSPQNLKIMRMIANLLAHYGQEEGLKQFTGTAEYQAVAAVSASGAASLRDQFTKPRSMERAIRLSEVPLNTAYGVTESNHALPALIVGTPRDPVHPLALAEKWATHFSQAEFVQVPSRDDDPISYEEGIRTAVQEHMSKTFLLRASMTRPPLEERIAGLTNSQGQNKEKHVHGWR